MIRCLLFAVLTVAVLVGLRGETRAQPDAIPRDLQYFQVFIDKPPTAEELARLSPGAQDIIVARVRIIGGPYYFIKRHQTPPYPKFSFAARLQVIEALQGNTTPGSVHQVSFGVPGTSHGYKRPRTPEQKARDYFIVSYVQGDGVRQ